jgi:alginate O-acetyltransferase complex protein AlgI
VAVVVTLFILNLAYFKYRNFLGEIIGIRFSAPGAISYLIPLGISFYTFEAISATVDVQRRKWQVPPITWSLFIGFMPHLAAGPIVRYRQLAPQFDSAKPFRFRNLSIGVHLFAIGFFKKLAADPIGQIIDPVWAAPSHAGAASLLLGLLGFYAQLFLDFSGYTDMGRGIARMLGYRLPVNFRAPFFAHNPSDFYQRWHVSLSSWIRIFVYDTLAIAVFRRIRSPRYRNVALFGVIMVVMVLFGLWHGSAWHFVLFGVCQGAVIVGWAMLTRGKSPRTKAAWLGSVLLLQATWLFSLIMFRAQDISVAGQYLAGFTHFDGDNDVQLLWCLVAVAGALATQSVDYWIRSRRVARAVRALRGTWQGFCVVCIAFIVLLALKIVIYPPNLSESGGGPPGGFIYFRF